MNKKKCIIIPVLNEEKNINKIFFKIKKTKISSDVLFIDDNSTDNTRLNIFELQKSNRNIKYIYRPKKMGIGSAHKHGIRWCYKKKYNLIITMDCDGTHDPRYLLDLIKESNFNDFVITTRFKKKNSIDDWPLHRKFLTILRLYLTKIILGIRYDASGAYRCFKTEKINIDDLIKIKSNDYNYFFESIFQLSKKKYKIKEIPIKLPYRKIGKSKMTIFHIFQSLMTLLRLKYFKK